MKLRKKEANKQTNEGREGEITNKKKERQAVRIKRKEKYWQFCWYLCVRLLDVGVVGTYVYCVIIIFQRHLINTKCNTVPIQELFYL